MVDGAAGDHQTGIEGPTSNASEGMPCPYCHKTVSFMQPDTRGLLTVVEPVPEAVEAILDEVFGGSEVEPRVDCSRVNACIRGIWWEYAHS